MHHGAAPLVQVIILEGCRVELAEEETEVFAFKIMFHGDGKVGLAGFV